MRRGSGLHRCMGSDISYCRGVVLMMGYSSLSADEARHRARELQHERDRADRLHDALVDISRKQIMDSVGAVNMRAIALAALASEIKW